MSGYDVHPSGDLAALRAEFPDYLICELHDEQGRTSYTAVHTDLATAVTEGPFTAPDTATLRERLRRRRFPPST